MQARGICGSGIIDAIAEMFKAGIIKKNGQINLELDSPRLREGNKMPEYVVAWKNETAIVPSSLPKVRFIPAASS